MKKNSFHFRDALSERFLFKYFHFCGDIGRITLVKCHHSIELVFGISGGGLGCRRNKEHLNMVTIIY